jgi:hypothetical protein
MPLATQNIGSAVIQNLSQKKAPANRGFLETLIGKSMTERLGSLADRRRAYQIL